MVLSKQRKASLSMRQTPNGGSPYKTPVGTPQNHNSHHKVKSGGTEEGQRELR